MKNLLTKTDFLKYLEAPRHLWAFKNNKLEREEEDSCQQHLIKQGYEVEELAEKYFLYRVYDYNENTEEVNLLKIQGELTSICDIPTSYRLNKKGKND